MSIEKVINIAFNEDGYLEKATNNKLDAKTENAGNANFTKYTRDLDGANYFNGRKQGFPWCAVFYNWCLFKAYGRDKALEITYQPKTNSCGAGCNEAMNYYKGAKQFYKEPKKGDQIFFSNSAVKACHTGLVIDVANGFVYTIEGNTSSASGVVDNGGCVRKKSYKLDYGRILGYGRPNWSLVEEKYMVERIKIFVDGEEKVIQRILNEGTNYVKLRDITECLGANVKYESNTKKIFLTSKN